MRNMIIVLFILILASISVYSLGVASDYLEDDILHIVDGSYKLYGIRLQNPTEKDITVKLSYDREHIKLGKNQDTYTIPPKSSHELIFNVSSGNLKPGQEKKISYSVRQLSGSGSGVPLLVQIAKNINIKIERIPDKFYISDLKEYKTQAIIVLAIGALYFVKIRSKRKNKFGKIKLKKRM